jgi:hypothetical protein
VARPRYQRYLLEVRQVDEELHLDTHALHHILKDERRVGPAPPDGDEHTRKGHGCLCEIDGEHRAGADVLRLCPREECADDVLLFGGREPLLEVCHGSLVLMKGRQGTCGSRMVMAMAIGASQVQS